MKYTGNALNEISFPLGGIGTGSIGLAGNGRLVDWEIFNRPNKGSRNGFSHIAVTATVDGKKVSKILNGDLTKGLMGDITDTWGSGPSFQIMCGYPHFRECTFNGEFPFASLDFSDPDFPGNVNLTAFNPFIPLDSDNSSIPAAFFEIRFQNPTDTPIEYQAVFSLSNPYSPSVNTEIHDGDFHGILLENPNCPPESTDFGQLCLTCENPSHVQPYWYRGPWRDGPVTYWNELNSEAGLSHRTYNGKINHKVYDNSGIYDTCSMAQTVQLQPGEEKKLRFVLSWNVPNNYNYWSKNGDRTPWKNYYATMFPSATDSARYSLKNFTSLYQRTLAYKETLFASTLDPAILDAVSATSSVLKSPTVFRLENGEFYGFEGSHKNTGSCEGTCQHVYNYAYALCFLFPDLERSIRDLEFDHCTMDTGATVFRMDLPLKPAKEYFRPCLDGQMGCVFKTYREWKISGDSDWLRKVWPTVKKILAYTWSEQNPDRWDLNKDGVLEGRQHHTLDMELFGPSSWLQGFYLAALRAASEMAAFLGEDTREYDELFEKGKAWTAENLFNGSHFFHMVDLNDKQLLESFNCVDSYWNEETKEIKYQIGEGSEIDQLCGQWHANICGLGKLFDEDQIHIALQSMMKNNFKETLRDFTNPWRIFCLNDESGTVMCDYPEGTYKPKIPVPYCEETMHGFEYQFAGLLMSEGFVEEGLRIVKSVRDRYQGHNRNPWNEMECGNNYIRSMASFALLPILSGFVFDLPREEIGFDPKVNQEDFRCLWSLGTGWGQVEISKNQTSVTLQDGRLKLSAIKLPFIKTPTAVIADGEPLPFDFKDGRLTFDSRIIRKTLCVAYEK